MEKKSAGNGLKVEFLVGELTPVSVMPDPPGKAPGGPVSGKQSATGEAMA